MRKKGSSEFEAAIKHANSLSQIRQSASAKYKKDVKTSLHQPIELLQSITQRLKLKDKPFSVFNSASDDEISDFFEALHFVDPSTQMTDSSKEVLYQSFKLSWSTVVWSAIIHSA